MDDKGKVAKPEKLSQGEKSFLSRNEVCRVATCTDDTPHVTPVSYIFDSGDSCLYFATDYDTKKYKNLKVNKNICVAIDVYGSSQDNAAVIITGVAEFIEKGKEFQRLYDLFFKRFAWVRGDPWKAGEAPFVKVVPKHKVSWGIK